MDFWCWSWHFSRAPVCGSGFSRYRLSSPSSKRPWSPFPASRRSVFENKQCPSCRVSPFITTSPWCTAHTYISCGFCSDYIAAAFKLATLWMEGAFPSPYFRLCSISTAVIVVERNVYGTQKPFLTDGSRRQTCRNQRIFNQTISLNKWHLVMLLRSISRLRWVPPPRSHAWPHQFSQSCFVVFKKEDEGFGYFLRSL